MTKIYFVGNLATTFIRRDYEILKKHFDVDVVKLPKTKFEWIKYPSLVKKKIKKSDVVFGWFAGWHTAPAVHYAKRYGKKSVVVAGGYDVVFLPEINYGAFTNLKEKIPAKYVLKNADLIISVSKSNQKELLEKVKPRKNILIYNGVPLNKFPPSGFDKENLAITVGGIKHSNLKRKGIETFVKSAKYLPDVHFAVIGKFIDDAIDYLKAIAPPNVEFTGFVSDEELVEWYQRAKVYVQVSAHEGFGITVAESMLCGCIPVVTKRFALPEVVGDCGFYVPYGDEKATAEAIRKALYAPNELGKKARERIKKMFSMERRERELVKTIRFLEVGVEEDKQHEKS